MGLCSAVCNAGFGECNGIASDGCETRLDGVMHCGRCGNTCTATPPSMPVCTTSGVCAVGCGEGTYREGAACVAVPAPRLLGPLSGATSTTQRPTFRWINAPISGRAEGARIQVCRDRACSAIVASVDVTGISATLGTALPPGVYFWRAFGRTDGNVGIAASPVWELVIGVREAPRAAAWGAYGDLNGDGFAEVVVTESALNQVHVYHGAVGGVPTRPNATRNDVVVGFAARAAIAGDVNGDGFVDLAVSAPGESAVYVFAGSTTGIAALGLRRTGSVGARFGAAIAAAGDVNGDGFGDLLVASGDGSVTVLRGGVSGLAPSIDVIRAPAGASGVPRVAGVGKVDDDLFDDVLLAWSEGTPAVLFVRGNAAGLASSTPVRIAASASVVSAAGDINGDGYADMLVANAATTTAWIYTGSATGVNTTPTFTLTDTSSGFASTGASLGDINGDGFGDVVLGNARNAAWVFLGAPRGELLRTVIPSSLRRFATGVGEAGDLNRDGFFDVVIGAPADAMGEGPCDGAVLVFNGARTGVTTSPAATLRPPDPKSCHTEFGAWVM
jgi:hypothetical protein